MKNRSFVFSMIFVAAVMRLIPHPANMTPVCALALFGAAYLKPRSLALFLPLSALFLSDLVLNNVIYKQYFTSFQWITSPIMYVALAAVVLVGFLRLRQISATNLAIASFTGSILFFLISNLWSWQWDPIYTKDFSGLMLCYTAGLPFLAKSMIGDLLYTAILFGTAEWYFQKQKAVFA